MSRAAALARTNTLPAASAANDASAIGRTIDRADWLRRFRTVRNETERRAAPLSPEDQMVQSMADASPTKWHRAHTTWFFEQFLLRPNLPEYRSYDDRFAFLFNSYYVAAGPRHARPERGLITRPNNAEVAAFRAHVDSAVAALIEDTPAPTLAPLLPVLEIGLNHEQQHQELILTDILHAFAHNPTLPVYHADAPVPGVAAGARSPAFGKMPFGIQTIGHDDESFSFDNEGPRHDVLLQPAAIARDLVTNSAWLAFMQDGGYSRPELWLSDGWATVQAESWIAPGFWQPKGNEWFSMTLAGLRPIDPAAPVCHVSYYEADAFARWSGKSLPSEAEWEVAARAELLDQAYGAVWQWTRSPYAPYPGYRPVAGALGEYNGKFMVNQMSLRGSSVVTPEAHSRVTYRNFFYPQQRWQFTGVRLVESPL